MAESAGFPNPPDLRVMASAGEPVDHDLISRRKIRNQLYREWRLLVRRERRWRRRSIIFGTVALAALIGLAVHLTMH